MFTYSYTVKDCLDSCVSIMDKILVSQDRGPGVSILRPSCKVQTKLAFTLKYLICDILNYIGPNGCSLYSAYQIVYVFVASLQFHSRLSKSKGGTIKLLRHRPIFLLGLYKIVKANMNGGKFRMSVDEHPAALGEVSFD